MTSIFPGSFDSFVNPLSGQPLNNPDQAALIVHLNDAVIELQNKVGINTSVNVNSIDYKLGHAVNSVRAGANVTIDNTDPNNPIVSSSGGGGGGGGITSVRGSTYVSIDSSNATSPIVSITGLFTSLTSGAGIIISGLTSGSPTIASTGVLSLTAGTNIGITPNGGGSYTVAATGVVQSVQAGSGITIGGTATNPTVALSGGAGGTSAEFNVLDYCAVPGLSVDCTNPIQNTIAAAAAAGGGIVFFPAGIYLISSSLSISSPWITLVGVDAWNSAGSGSEILLTTNFSQAQALNITASGVTIKNLGIKGTTATNAIIATGTALVPITGVTLQNIYIYGISGIMVNYASSVVMENITPVHWSGTAAFYVTNSQDVFFNKCIPTNSTVGTTYGFYTGTCTRVDYENCEVQDTIVSICLYATATTHANIDGFIVTGPANFGSFNSCSNWGFVGVDFAGTGKGFNFTGITSNISISDGSILSTTDNAINIDGTGSGNSAIHIGIVNCNLEQSGSSTASLVAISGAAYAITISANRFTNVGTNLAIYDNSTTAARHCVYSGNTFYPGGLNCISVIAGPNVITNGNSGYPTSLNGVQISATPPSNGQVLTASSGTAAAWNAPVNNNLNNVIVSATPTSTGQLLTATGTNTATWQNAPSGGGGGGMDLLAGTQIVITNATSATPTISTTGLVHTITAGSNVTITGTATDPIVSSTGGGGAGKLAYYSATPGSSPAAIDTNTYQTVRWTQLNSAITVSTTPTNGNPPYDGDTLSISFAQTTSPGFTINWSSMFQASSTVALPSLTFASNRMDVGFIWNATDSKWRCVFVV